MKRFFFATIALAAVAIGCTKSGLIESPQTYEEPITFEPYTGKLPVTKATEAKSDTTLKRSGFRVIGFTETQNGAITTTGTPFLDKVVRWGKPTSEATADKWYYEGAAYWPDGQNLSFMAYGLNVNEETGKGSPAITDRFVMNGSDYSSFTYTVPEKVALQKDLVISPVLKGVNNSGEGDKTVRFQMKHVLSRIGFSVLTTGTAGVEIIIKNIKLQGSFATQGTVDLDAMTTGETPTPATPSISPSSSKTAMTYSLFDSDYDKTKTSGNFKGFITSSVNNQTTAIYNNTSFAAGSEYDPDGKSGDAAAASDSRFMMLMPGNVGPNAKIEVTYQLSGGEDMVAEVSIANFNFAGGTAYEFVFSVSTVAVGFNVQVKEWSDTENPAHTVTLPLS